MTTVALFSTYAPSEGFGGPARTYHQRRVLENAGFRVVHVVIEASPSRGQIRPHDYVALVERPFREAVDHIYADVDLGCRAARDLRLVERIRSHLLEQQAQLIILEQPFLCDLVSKVADALGTPVIYSCQNVEYRLRRDLERFQFLRDRPTNRADEVREIETAAMELAAAVTTICPTDQAALADEFGVDSVIVPNGTAIADVEVAPTTHIEPVDFVFAGSSYWPNLEGFAQMATPSLAFLPPTTRIHVIGSAANDLLSVPSLARRHSINASRTVLRGFVPMSELVATMRAARCVLVPVFVGEGSNLKSADALASGAPVIMTERATRGYEDVIAQDPEGVTVTDDIPSFRAAMRSALDLPVRHDVGRTRRRLLSWDVRLRPLVDLVDSTARAAR